MDAIFSMEEELIDKISGFRGRVISWSYHVDGTITYLLQPFCGEGTRVVEPRSFDSKRLSTPDEDAVSGYL